MAADYDLVIIGGSAIARYAAAAASRLKARVALVEPDSQLHETALMGCHTLIQAGRIAQQMRRAKQWGFQDSAIRGKLQWQRTAEWAQGTAELAAEGGVEPLTLLMAAGVDVILGQGEFYRRPQLGFAIHGRQLRSRAYLLAPATQPILPAIKGLATVHYLTLNTLWSQPWTVPPARLIILAGDLRGIELAQAFNRLGSQVTLILGDRLLPQEELEVANLVQAQLEAEGVMVLTQTEVTQVRQLGEQIWVQVGDRALETEALLLASGQQPNLDSLNLEAVAVKGGKQGILVNRKLQTTNSQIYACGESLGGYSFQHLARYEADIAVRNALFFATRQTHYQQIPWVLFTDPELARVGLTETQARHAFGSEILVLRQSLKPIAKAQIHGTTTGFCKLIVRRNGEILGAYLIGAEASEWVNSIALAIKQRIKIGAIADLAFVSPTFSEIIRHAAQQWQVQRLRPWQQDWLEGWFNFLKEM
jgi:pyruvate/2-oxoglutarate dehydrogenase complex dihydrolipoamide dehydrogenase (E3) component